MAANPVLVEVVRGDAVESRHRGAAAVVDAAGRLVESWGDIGRPVYARSAAKPLQALPLIESGAAARFRLTDIEIALACASHSGEAEQTLVVAAWLERLGLSPTDLECGAHMPMDEAAARAIIRNGGQPSALHNNCSGKHAGFLTAAVHLGEPTAGYIGLNHPVQQRVTAALAEMAGFDAYRAPKGVDGCGIPVIGLSLEALARGMARLGAPSSVLGEGRVAACRRIVTAMVAHPRTVAGTGRFDTIAMGAGRGAFATKTGAEGVYVVIAPGRGLGAALKIDDGASRAAEVAMAHLLDHLGLLDDAGRMGLSAYLAPRLRNWAGTPIGALRAAADWLS